MQIFAKPVFPHTHFSYSLNFWGNGLMFFVAAVNTYSVISIERCLAIFSSNFISIVQYVMILIHGGVPIAFAGTEEPAAYGELISIGSLGPGVNGKLSSTIAEILQTKLSIDSSRFYIKLYDVEVIY